MTTTHKNLARDKLIVSNLSEFNEPLDTIPRITPSQATEAEIRREEILKTINPFITSSFKDTKPHFRNLSPGCRICGLGRWSCLFINGKCNCHCFYCPTAQDDISVPTTNQIPFPRAGDYADYVTKFHFSGVSISGGEPLLTFDRSWKYIEKVRNTSGEDLHIWLYTNGTLLTRERLETLKASGLNEIRFDISAVDYDMNKAHMAAGVIPCVTVEIPAIPEDYERLAGLLPAMVDAGVQYLNLHQLRMTPFNSARLRKRNYTFLHDEGITVLESEISALRILQKAIEEKLPLPINYCSFPYKHRFQRAANRSRNAQGILKGYESITENGFIRLMTLTGSPEILGRQAERLDRFGSDPMQWSINTRKDRLHFHETLWPLIDFNACRLQLDYFEAVLCPNISYRCMYKELRIGQGKKVYLEKRPVRVDLILEESEYLYFEKAVIRKDPEALPGTDSLREEIMRYEFIQPGLQEYETTGQEPVVS